MPCQVPSASRPPTRGMESWTWVSAARMCAGMSSGPSHVWLYGKSSGAIAEKDASRSCRTLGSAFSLIVSEADDPTPPCGMCRQAFVEFAPGLPIASFTLEGRAAEWTLAMLLPHPFTPAALTHHHHQ